MKHMIVTVDLDRPFTEEQLIEEVSRAVRHGYSLTQESWYGQMKTGTKFETRAKLGPAWVELKGKA